MTHSGGTSRNAISPHALKAHSMPAAADADAKKPGAVQRKFCCQTNAQFKPCWNVIASETPSVLMPKYTAVKTTRPSTCLAGSAAPDITPVYASAAPTQESEQFAMSKKV